MRDNNFAPAAVQQMRLQEENRAIRARILFLEGRLQAILLQLQEVFPLHVIMPLLQQAGLRHLDARVFAAHLAELRAGEVARELMEPVVNENTALRARIAELTRDNDNAHQREERLLAQLRERDRELAESNYRADQAERQVVLLSENASRVAVPEPELTAMAANAVPAAVTAVLPTKKQMRAREKLLRNEKEMRDHIERLHMAFDFRMGALFAQSKEEAQKAEASRREKEERAAKQRLADARSAAVRMQTARRERESFETVEAQRYLKLVATEKEEWAAIKEAFKEKMLQISRLMAEKEGLRQQFAEQVQLYSTQEAEACLQIEHNENSDRMLLFSLFNSGRTLIEAELEKRARIAAARAAATPVSQSARPLINIGAAVKDRRHESFRQTQNQKIKNLLKMTNDLAKLPNYRTCNDRSIFAESHFQYFVLMVENWPKMTEMHKQFGIMALIQHFYQFIPNPFVLYRGRSFSRDWNSLSPPIKGKYSKQCTEFQSKKNSLDLFYHCNDQMKEFVKKLCESLLAVNVFAIEIQIANRGSQELIDLLLSLTECLMDLIGTIALTTPQSEGELLRPVDCHNVIFSQWARLLSNAILKKPIAETSSPEQARNDEDVRRVALLDSILSDDAFIAMRGHLPRQESEMGASAAAARMQP